MSYPRLASLFWNGREGNDAWREQIAQTMMDLDMELVDEDIPHLFSDGLLYFRVRVPTNIGQIAVTLREMSDLPAESTAGLAVLDENDEAIFVFSHGDLLSLMLYGKMRVEWPAPWDRPTDVAAVESGTISVGSPDLNFLPERVRHSIRNLYWAFGILEPKVTALKVVPDAPMDLAFHAPLDVFEDVAHRDWFLTAAVPMMLPKHLRIRTVRTDTALPSFPL